MRVNNSRSLQENSELVVPLAAALVGVAIILILCVWQLKAWMCDDDNILALEQTKKQTRRGSERDVTTTELSLSGNDVDEEGGNRERVTEREPEQEHAFAAFAESSSSDNSVESPKSFINPFKTATKVETKLRLSLAEQFIRSLNQILIGLVGSRWSFTAGDSIEYASSDAPDPRERSDSSRDGSIGEIGSDGMFLDDKIGSLASAPLQTIAEEGEDFADGERDGSAVATESIGLQVLLDDESTSSSNSDHMMSAHRERRKLSLETWYESNSPVAKLKSSKRHQEDLFEKSKARIQARRETDELDVKQIPRTRKGTHQLLSNAISTGSVFVDYETSQLCMSDRGHGTLEKSGVMKTNSPARLSI